MKHTLALLTALLLAPLAPLAALNGVLALLAQQPNNGLASEVPGSNLKDTLCIRVTRGQATFL